jgi:hypothetical protein
VTQLTSSFILCCFLPLSLFSTEAIGQSGAVIPEGGAGHAAQATCIILKRMGPADEVTSHLYSFGIRGKQFQYVEGKLPEGFPFHGRLTDHDVRNLQARGAEIIVIEAHYTADDLKQARAECRGETGKTPNQAEAVEAPPAGTAGGKPTAPEAGKTDPTSAASDPTVPAAIPVATAPATAPSAAKLSIASTPDGADIELDGNFVGNSPSELQVAEGDHTIAVKKPGFKDWQRTMKISGGSSVHLNAELEKLPTQ